MRNSNQDLQMAVAMSGEEVVYRLHGDSAICSGSPSGYLVGEPLAGSTKSDVGAIRSILGVRGTTIVLARRVQGRSIRVSVGSASIGNCISAQCQAKLELEVQPEADIE